MLALNNFLSMLRKKNCLINNKLPKHLQPIPSDSFTLTFAFKINNNA